MRRKWKKEDVLDLVDRHEKFLGDKIDFFENEGISRGHYYSLRNRFLKNNIQNTSINPIVSIIPNSSILEMEIGNTFKIKGHPKEIGKLIRELGIS
ncbi:MAG: hypothetical protein HRT69_18345 [Flavobacteriaceae bacterium]|nr:hypothetical protein [Flavobacteriaceae bacterium]